ncbi:MAG TPA: 16S rRNA (guanine(527)-N(7))-methyltransferase RsmG [Tepidisphaeraceae bacterium]|nr:16S rRNA (guanine(527)-N(7))-methyltransferase RsmG [Tepidisphaeraceae bacterium]
MSAEHAQPVETLWRSLAGESLDAERIARLHRYLDLLEAGNQRFNLTRIIDRAHAEREHIADALTLLPLLPAGSGRIADIGSGGGVPALVIAIARPDLEVVCLESTGKKSRFLTETIAALSLGNARVISTRVELHGRAEGRERYHAVTARAVAELSWLGEWSMPLVGRGGRLLAMKGPKHVDELPAMRARRSILGAGEPVVHAVPVRQENDTIDETIRTHFAGRVIVEIPRVGSISDKLPRDPANAKGKPL